MCVTVRVCWTQVRASTVIRRAQEAQCEVWTQLLDQTSHQEIFGARAMLAAHAAWLVHGQLLRESKTTATAAAATAAALAAVGQGARLTQCCMYFSHVHACKQCTS